MTVKIKVRRMEYKTDEQVAGIPRETLEEWKQTCPKDPNEFFVDKVVDHRFNRQGLPEFLVFWKGYAKSAASWNHYRM